MKQMKQTERISADQTLMAGIAKRLGPTVTIILSGVSRSPADLVAILKSRVDAEVAVQNAHAALKAALAAMAKTQSDTAQTVEDLRQTLLAMFRTTPGALV